MNNSNLKLNYFTGNLTEQFGLFKIPDLCLSPPPRERSEWIAPVNFINIFKWTNS